MIFSKEKRKQALYQQVFSTPQGEKVLKDLLQRHFVFSTTHVPTDPYTSAFQEGRRAVVTDILRYLHADLNHLEQQLEAVNEQ